MLRRKETRISEIEEAGDDAVEEGARSPGLIRAAETMEGRFGEIFADYERRLNEMGSLLVVGEGNPHEQLEKNARDVLERAEKGPARRHTPSCTEALYIL